jgi:hypothetical protein
MQFRLTYRGPLKAEGRKDPRAKEKHAIRRAIRPQLAEVWNTHPFLRAFMQAHIRSQRVDVNVSAPTLEELREKMLVTEYDSFTVAQKIAKRFAHGGYSFLPLVGAVFDGIQTACALDVLFLRRDGPGSLIKSGGDIDNRLKVLFDALKMPRPGEFDSSVPPAPDEDPFFCLVEDDSLITEIKVTTDRLLTPQADDEHLHDVHLVIHVRTILTGFTAANTGAVAAFST